MGYRLAGFDVTGVDIVPQPHYPFAFVQADTLEYLSDHGHEYAAIAASPPCQYYANVTAWRGDRANHPDLIHAVRVRLVRAGVPWAMENVPEAPLRRDLLLCGSQFGLAVRRHRVFELSHPTFELLPPCHHHRGLVPFMHKDERAFADAMGCTWMTKLEAREAIPPAYTEHVGYFLLQQVPGAAGRRPPQASRPTTSQSVGRAPGELAAAPVHTTRGAL
jgi:hypothetical protein